MRCVVKLPKRVVIGCGEYTIIKNSREVSSWFDLRTKEISIGTKKKQPLQILEAFFHEVFEIAAAVGLCRYLDGANTEYLFVMTHKEFDQIMVHFTQAIKDVQIFNRR